MSLVWSPPAECANRSQVRHWPTNRPTTRLSRRAKHLARGNRAILTVAAAATESTGSRGSAAPPMVITLDGRVIRVVAVADRLRTGATEVSARLHRTGAKKVIVLAGDPGRYRGQSPLSTHGWSCHS